jgi:hypothetical protein
MKRLLLLFILAMSVMVSALSCKHNPYLPDDLTDDPNANCDTTNLSLLSDIRPIFQASCMGCHSSTSANVSGAGINLETYSSLQTYAGNGLLSCSVLHGSSCTPMPFGGAKLPDCQVEKILSWINAGALNN